MLTLLIVITVICNFRYDASESNYYIRTRG